MPRQKYHRSRVHQEIGEPGTGSIAVGYVRYSSELQNETTIVTQKRLINEYLEKKGWKLARWYEEPEQSAKYDSIEDRPVFSQLLNDAGTRFQVVVCAFSNRWARSMEAGYASLSRLRRMRVWWVTADDRWDIDRVQQDGFDVAFAVDMQMNASYVRQLSKRTIAGKEDRARDGYHNGSVMFGYLPPEYPKAPDGAPSTWRPPRMPVRPDPITFPALVRIGELTAQGWTDRAIANELYSYLSRTARFGERYLTKDTIAGIRRSWFPREFAPESGHGTIDTPSGELVEGRHQAAWPYDLWQRMVEVKAGQYRRPRKEAEKRPHEFSRIIVCAGCLRPLRVKGGANGANYYVDTSLERKLPCPTVGNLSVRASLVMLQFGEILRSFELPLAWREEIAQRCQDTSNERDDEGDLYTKGYIAEQALDEQMERVRAELFSLPVPLVQSAEKFTKEALSAGETLERVADYWNEALPEERRDMVWSLLLIEGLVYDLERYVIVGLKPRSGVLPALALGLEATDMWEQRDNGLWLREDYWPPKQDHKRSGPAPQLTPAEQERAIMLIRQGMSLRQVADLFNVSYELMRRLAKSYNIERRQGGRRLTPEQLEEAYRLLKLGISFRDVAQRYGIHHESLRRLTKRDAVDLQSGEEKPTPTQRKLSPEQQQEARTLIELGGSYRQVAKQFGISRGALKGLLEEKDED